MRTCLCAHVHVEEIVHLNVLVSGLAAVVPSVCHYNVDRTVAQVNYHDNRLIIPIKQYWAYWWHWLLSASTHECIHRLCVVADDERHQKKYRKKALYQEAPIRMNGNGDEWIVHLCAKQGLCVASVRNRKWTGSFWQVEVGFRADRQFSKWPTVDWKG